MNSILAFYHNLSSWWFWYLPILRYISDSFYLKPLMNLALAREISLLKQHINNAKVAGSVFTQGPCKNQMINV